MSLPRERQIAMLTADVAPGRVARGCVFSRAEPRHKQDIVRLLKNMVPLSSFFFILYHIIIIFDSLSHHSANGLCRSSLHSLSRHILAHHVKWLSELTSAGLVRKTFVDFVRLISRT